MSGRPSQTAGGERKPDAFESQNMDISTEELRNYGLAGGGVGGGLIARQRGLFNSDETRALSSSLARSPSLSPSLHPSECVCVSSSVKQDNSVLTLRIRTSIQL